MKIDGRIIASEIKANLTQKISGLRQKNIIPQLAVVLIGNDPSSEAYVRQKLKVGGEIGAKVTLIRLNPDDTKENLIKIVKKLNTDKSIHGIIIQRPSPIEISKVELDLLVFPQKDVDGFHPDSPFTPPIASAVLKILMYVQKDLHNSLDITFNDWFKKQEVLVIGRGETAGKPIAETLNKLSNNITIAHSQTADLKNVCLASDIIITCVGRPNVVQHDMVSPNTLLIGVGLHQENGKLKTDYNQEEIAGKVAYYTPVPGGVGPVNVACLFENLIKSIRIDFK
ncbi:bifunctional 5,10-methylenetetrahydrofolate dehydrogenase/5,10-methenyltetrahydrofolate cyclohydrolase [Candidatus Gottesmanbacteria bacterium]|nr:bifunctional 5,10-methylenetetrahydrofolate dehydrogenase/5,10-methenyltetrahydrofolate cyclohydrolase [Candidatus Gottesmanbacteria bacterium]